MRHFRNTRDYFLVPIAKVNLLSFLSVSGTITECNDGIISKKRKTLGNAYLENFDGETEVCPECVGRFESVG